MGRPLRLVFFGTPGFAVPTLEGLLASAHTVVAAVTQPDRPRNRGHRLSAPPVKVLAERHQVPVLQPDRLKGEGFLDVCRGLAPDCGIVAAYGRILPDALLAIPRLGFLNVHASLLPQFRGAAPVARAILAGARETGVTIMRVVHALDAGPMLATARHQIKDDDTSENVERALAVMGAALLLDVLDRLEAGVPELAQDDRQATYAPRITKEDGPIDWTRPARAIHNQVRALHPWPHAWTFLGGARLIIRRTAVSPGEANADAGKRAAPGTVVVATGDILRVQCGHGALDILTLQPEGRGPMPARAFLAGHARCAGARFSTPG